MEAKLKEFKSRRRREILLNKPKQLLNDILDRFSFKNDTLQENVKSPLVGEESPGNTPRVLDDDERSILSVASSDISISLPLMTWSNMLLYALYFVLWVIFYLIAIQLEFGYVYLVLSGLVFIYFNTRTGPKKEGEISAYSVFNPGCEAIEGTLKAEQLEREFNLIQHEKPSPHRS
ncbi:hypothetical protein RUM44_001402 [Polyplax serrata]|uniref:SAYSvFN domain-containing protein n=1 Tax=Polyplax serrata TaxID=468196 RepID=A0ABR1AJX1_POLSC